MMGCRPRDLLTRRQCDAVSVANGDAVDLANDLADLAGGGGPVHVFCGFSAAA
jgi:hypothetical protein